jgi:hypothetical protein
MNRGLIAALALLTGVTVLAGGGALFLLVLTLPGMRLLPKESRVVLDGVTTIDDAVETCKRTGLQGWELVAYAQKLAARKFTYSRRNPWDTSARAFERGMGYCQQQALALKRIYDRLGIRSEPVYALKCKFPARTIHVIPEPERISPHTWLRVKVGEEVRDVCLGSAGNSPGKVHFEVLSEVRPLPVWMRPFSHLGSVLENTRRDQ